MNTQKDKIAIIIPVYNEEETIEFCIKEALKAIEMSSFEARVIVVDNNSEDNSVKIAQNYDVDIFKNPSRVTVLIYITA